MLLLLQPTKGVIKVIDLCALLALLVWQLIIQYNSNWRSSQWWKMVTRLFLLLTGMLRRRFGYQRSNWSRTTQHRISKRTVYKMASKLPKSCRILLLNTYLTGTEKRIMIPGKIIGISLVLLVISHNAVGYNEKSLFYHNNTVGGCRETDFVSDTSSQNGYVFNSLDQEASRSFTAGSRPLILTPYIKNKKFQEGIEAAKVTSFLAEIESYAGFFEVDKKLKSYLFFWYFPPLSEEYVPRSVAPVILWIQGGMGQSGLYAAFRENGPVHLEPNGKMIFNPYSWAERAHLLYIDSPVGAGYSFTKSGKYPTSQDEVTTDLFAALRQFLTLFQLKKNPLFIVGQSYGAKTVCALGAEIHKSNFKLNFQGVAIGNGFVDPPNMLEYGKYLYQLGFIDLEARYKLYSARKAIQDYLKNGNYEEALLKYVDTVQFSPVKIVTKANNFPEDTPYIDWVTALVSKLNFTQVRRGVNEDKLLGKYLNRPTIQNALHTPDNSFVKTNSKVRSAIWPEVLETQVHNLKLLMNHYRVLLYNGQMTIKNAYPLVLEYLKKIKWRDGKKYRKAERVQWKVDGELAGYFKTGGRFTELLMRNAGCHVPADQPKWSQRMINSFIYNNNLNEEFEMSEN